MKRILFLFLLLPFIGHAQIITTIAGGGTSGSTGDGGLAKIAKIADSHFGTFDKFGNYYFSQFSFETVRKIDTAGIITTVAGIGSFGFGGDNGPASTASFKYIEGIACDTFGNLFIADHQNFRIRKVDIATGIITTFAGTGIGTASGDGGPATAGAFFPTDIHFDKRGNLYISDGYNNNIRKVNVSGIISTYAGTGVIGYGGDGGPATAAQLWNPLCIAVDSKDNLYLTDRMNKRVRKIDTFGIISTVAGNGITLYSGDGIPATATGIGPLALCIDNMDNLYVSDSNQRIRMVNNMGIIYTVVGTGIAGYNGDGIPSTSAQIYTPLGIAFDACGNMYFEDEINYRIRKVTMPIPPVVVSLTVPVSAPIGSLVTITASITGAGSSYSIEWMNHGVSFATTTIPSVTYTKTFSDDSITAKVFPASGCFDSGSSSMHVVTTSHVGINNFLSQSIQIYPNPAHNELSIIAGNKISNVTISSLIGQVVYSEVALSHAMTGELWKVNIENLPAGVYVVKVTDSEGIKTVGKFVKE